MQQHPVPQNVTQYQFRLVGDMTLKQFLELVVGLIFAYLFYASNLVFFFKWPLVIFSVIFGFGLAFFPIEDRPLDQWIINFVKAIYAPTRFTWQKTNKVPRLFLFSARKQEISTAVTKTIKAPVLTSKAADVPDLTDSESAKLQAIDALIGSAPSSSSPVPEQVARPSVSVRKLGSPGSASPPPLKAQAVPVSAPAPKRPAENVIFTAPTAPPATRREAPATSSPKHITLPASPKDPNFVTGVVVDREGKLVENAIVQIVSADGIPARAMKTNSLGQFYTSTPLQNGPYVIEVDKDSLAFAPQPIVMSGTVLSPIELRAST